MISGLTLEFHKYFLINECLAFNNYLHYAGGTADITTVKVRDDLSLEHVQSSGGGPWGGVNVDDKFFTLLRELIGPEIFKEVQDSDPNWKSMEYDMRTWFESAKRKVGVNMLLCHLFNLYYIVSLNYRCVRSTVVKNGRS